MPHEEYEILSYIEIFDQFLACGLQIVHVVVRLKINLVEIYGIVVKRFSLCRVDVLVAIFANHEHVALPRVGLAGFVRHVGKQFVYVCFGFGCRDKRDASNRDVEQSV